MGGAVGIRASGCENIAAIRAAVDLPVIGITKGVFPDGSVLITEDFADVGMLIDAGAQLVALDVTQRVRPNGLTGCDFLQAVKERYDVAVMADVATLAGGIAASEAGADFVAPTLAGHTPYCSQPDNREPDCGRWWKIWSKHRRTAARVPGHHLCPRARRHDAGLYRSSVKFVAPTAAERIGFALLDAGAGVGCADCNRAGQPA